MNIELCELIVGNEYNLAHLRYDYLTSLNEERMWVIKNAHCAVKAYDVGNNYFKIVSMERSDENKSE